MAEMSLERKTLPFALLEPGDPLGGFAWPAVASTLSFHVEKRTQRHNEAFLPQERVLPVAP